MGLWIPITTSDGAISEVYTISKSASHEVFLCMSEKEFLKASYLVRRAAVSMDNIIWTMVKLSDEDMERFIEDGRIGDIFASQNVVWVVKRDRRCITTVTKMPPSDIADLLPARDISMNFTQDEKTGLRRACEGLAYAQTKDEIRKRLLAGEPPRQALELFEYYDGSEVFKTDRFAPGNLVIYVPELSGLVNVYSSAVAVVPEEILKHCYTGDDFIEICGGSVEWAERVFNACTWETPSTCYNEIYNEGEDNE